MACQEMLGGPKAPGIGFAIGEDRLVLTLEAQRAGEHLAEHADAYLAPHGNGPRCSGAGARA